MKPIQILKHNLMHSLLNIPLISIPIMLLMFAACLPDRKNILTPAIPEPQVHYRTLTSPAPATDTQTTQAETQPTLPLTNPELAYAVYGDRLIETISIPSLDITAPVIPVGWSPDPSDPQNSTWDSPGAQVGWVFTSALPDEGYGNVILYGHNNIDSSVFLNLASIKTGDKVLLQTRQREWVYQVQIVNILPVLSASEDALAYSEYFKSTRAPRLTIVSCWPPDNNTHRVIIIAYPLYGIL